MRDQITGMRVFVRVAAAGSLAGAGRSLDLSQTMVTKLVDAIETRLGTKLLHRSTRNLTLTEAGRTYLEACVRILGRDSRSRNDLRRRVRPKHADCCAKNVPVSFGTRCIAPLIGTFRGRDPKVDVEFGLNDRLVDLVDEGCDLAVRIGVLPDSSLMARSLAPCRTVVCASPANLKAQGAPRTLADLSLLQMPRLHPVRKGWAPIIGASDRKRPPSVAWSRARSRPTMETPCAKRIYRDKASATSRQSLWRTISEPERWSASTSTNRPRQRAIMSRNLPARSALAAEVALS